MYLKQLDSWEHEQPFRAIYLALASKVLRTECCLTTNPFIMTGESRDEHRLPLREQLLSLLFQTSIQPAKSSRGRAMLPEYATDQERVAVRHAKLHLHASRFPTMQAFPHVVSSQDPLITPREIHCGNVPGTVQCNGMN